MVNLAVCLMGPTASGKTDLACQLVETFPFEIISVDSAMIYRGMDIGTAKPTQEHLARAPHHLIDVLDPIESYSAAYFCRDAEQLCKEIHSRGKIPLLVGGTMMYFNALQKGIATLPEANESLRAQLLQQGSTLGWPALHNRLLSVDPVAAARIHPHDSQRIQRALEVYELTGKPLSELVHQTAEPSKERFINLLLMPDERSWLHERIALRFEQMLDQGFLDEVKTLLQQWPLNLSHPAMKSVGYRQALLYLQDEIDYETFIATGIAATRQLAKRQLTWLRHWSNGQQFTAENPLICREVMARISKILDNKFRKIKE
ncbi:tRNA (adenosine(37)-N6)-dimethylallyltransferase MiaA [Legionella yabuuchiae]|uniref:tRNA (adenosine(37)-N6)-dimethylallyltransferase MiaA n=1 Tax=Legionella yabuuchiae TaxID=376727 RepID=UPI001056A71E|nr:tRNA (adenosine(37)-N6)-dimethylallyltransferase MiaA [Legionella yabuuchiae]